MNLSAALSCVAAAEWLFVHVLLLQSCILSLRTCLEIVQDMYADDPNAKSVGALSIGVPGELAGLYLAWRNHGMLPWKKLVYPAFRVAYNGFEVTPYLALKIANKEQQILSHGGLAEFLAPNGTILAAGEICHRRQLAKTLELIARFGPRAFYRGSIAVKLVKDVQEAGGILSLQDLANYQVRVRKAIHADVMNYTVIGMPPPSSGGAAMILVGLRFPDLCDRCLQS